MKKEKENEFYVFLPLVIYITIILIIGIVMSVSYTHLTLPTNSRV